MSMKEDKKNPICSNCGNHMSEVCSIGNEIKTENGIWIQKLYQCPEDKTISADYR